MMATMASSSQHPADSHDLIRVQGARENNLRAVPGRVYDELSRSSRRAAGRWLENHRWRLATVGEGHEHGGRD